MSNVADGAPKKNWFARHKILTGILERVRKAPPSLRGADATKQSPRASDEIATLGLRPRSRRRTFRTGS